MAVTIAQLDIEIKSTGDKSIAAFTKLANKLNTLSAHLEKTASSMRKVSGDMKKMGKETEKAGASAEKGAKGLGSFANSILRIMKYRAIRAVLKTITQGFREGVQNIALYSAAINEMDASKANNVMSAYASMGAQIKNSLGAAVMPALANLLPVIQQVADWFMDAAEAVAQFFAALNGQSTYTAANRDYWVDYAKGLQKSTGAAKELKRTILGFDEINALNSQSKGGSGSNALNYKDMFVEKDNPMSLEKAKKILDIIKTIGLALAAWKIATPVIDALRGLVQLSRLKTFAIGLALTITGVTLGYMGGANVANGNLGLGFGQGLGGIVAAAVGGTLMGGSLGHPLIGLAVGLFVGLASFAFGIIDQQAANNAKKYIANALKGTGFTIDDFSGDALKAHVDLATEIRNKVVDIKTFTKPQTLKDLEYARTLIEDIFSLNSIEVKTPEQMRALNRYVEIFNGLNLDGIQLEFDDTTSKIKQTKEEIYKTISALEQQIKLEVYSEKAKAAFQAQIDAQEHYNELLDQRKVYLKALEEAESKADYMGAAKIRKDLAELEKAFYTEQTNIKELGVQYEKFTKLATGATNDWKDAIKGVGSTISGLTFPKYNNGNWSLVRPELKASGGFVPSGDLFVAGEAGAELVMAAPNGSEVVNMAQFERAMMNAVSMAGGTGGDWTIVVQDGNGAERSRQVITAAERANRRDGRTIIPVGVY